MSAVTDVFDAVESVITSAGASVSPAITQIVCGEPTALSNYNLVAYWFLGERPWESDTFSRTQRELGFRITLYLPGTIRSKGTNKIVEEQLAAFGRALYGGFANHVALGGKATGGGVHLPDCNPTATWLTVADVLCRGLTADLWVYMAALDTIDA